MCVLGLKLTCGEFIFEGFELGLRFSDARVVLVEKNLY